MQNTTDFFIDLFCGAGGVTTGIMEAMIDGLPAASVIACVNHDPMAIKSHAANHPEVLHFTEDIRTLDLTSLRQLVIRIRANYPDARIHLWASLECTNFSRAKGGQPKIADSRTLANDLRRYIIDLDPEFIWIENVREFMDWGPLDENMMPIKALYGTEFNRWKSDVENIGYSFDYRLLNCADFGAYTSRTRFFAQFAKPGLPIEWPEPTHAKIPGLTGKTKWNAVKEVLDFSDEGESILTRKKKLSKKTLERVYQGLIRFIAGGDTAFLVKYLGNNAKTGINKGKSVNDPAPTLTTQNRFYVVNTQFVTSCYSSKHNNSGIDSPCPTILSRDKHYMVQAKFLSKYYGGDKHNISLSGPASTITGIDHHALVSPEFIAKYHGNGHNCSSVDTSCPAIGTKDQCALVQPRWIDRPFKGGGQLGEIGLPAGSILSVPKLNLVQTKFLMDTQFNNKCSSVDEPMKTITANRKHYYILNPQFKSPGSSIDAPSPTVIAAQNKKPLYLISTDSGELAIRIYAKDCAITRKIKAFMAAYGIIDIKMRMLRVPELKRITGFEDDYYLAGNQSIQKKFIGNAVPPPMVKAMIEASVRKLRNHQIQQQA